MEKAYYDFIVKCSVVTTRVYGNSAVSFSWHLDSKGEAGGGPSDSNVGGTRTDGKTSREQDTEKSTGHR